MDPFSPRRQWDADDIEAAELTAKEAGVDLLLSYASWRVHTLSSCYDVTISH